MSASPRPRRRRGFTLVELLVVVAILGVLATSAIPRFGLAFERARVDEASSALRSIWHAQRMYWMEHKAFAPDLATLVDEKLLDALLAQAKPPFSFRVLGARPTEFRAEAERIGARWWSGTLVLDETGEVTGGVRNGDGILVRPTPID